MYEGQTFNCSVLISLCSCHLIKNISDDVNKYYTKKDKELTNRSLACLVTACVSPAFNIIDVEILDKWFSAVTTLLLSSNRTSCVDRAMKVLKMLSSNSVTILVDELIAKQNSSVEALNSLKRDSNATYRYIDSNL